MSEERKRVLRMLQEGKISLDEAEDLLSSVSYEVTGERSVDEKKGGFLRIRIESEEQEKVNVNIPLSLARMALKVVPDKVKRELREGKHEIELEEIIDQLSLDMQRQKIVDINDDEGNVVEIYVE